MTKYIVEVVINSRNPIDKSQYPQLADTIKNIIGPWCESAEVIAEKEPDKTEEERREWLKRAQLI